MLSTPSKWMLLIVSLFLPSSPLVLLTMHGCVDRDVRYLVTMHRATWTGSRHCCQYLGRIWFFSLNYPIQLPQGRHRQLPQQMWKQNHICLLITEPYPHTQSSNQILTSTSLTTMNQGLYLSKGLHGAPYISTSREKKKICIKDYSTLKKYCN